MCFRSHCSRLHEKFISTNLVLPRIQTHDEMSLTRKRKDKDEFSRDESFQTLVRACRVRTADAAVIDNDNPLSGLRGRHKSGPQVPRIWFLLLLTTPACNILATWDPLFCRPLKAPPQAVLSVTLVVNPIPINIFF